MGEWHWQFVFPSAIMNPDRMTAEACRFRASGSTLQKAVKRVVEAAGVEARARCHTLRHSFATHLLELGYDISTIGRGWWSTTSGFIFSLEPEMILLV